MDPTAPLPGVGAALWLQDPQGLAEVLQNSATPCSMGAVPSYSHDGQCIGTSASTTTQHRHIRCDRARRRCSTSPGSCCGCIACWAPTKTLT